MMNVLMLSSSKVEDSDYLSQPKPLILKHLHRNSDNVIFIPYAGVSISWDNYHNKVCEALPELNISSIHQFASPTEAISQATAIMVGGGNTFNLVHHLYENNLMQHIVERVKYGVPYVGWSAGSNICGLSIKTTNDMPIIQPKSFNTFGFIPIQINPHYTDYVAPNHNGETRDMRIQEFCALEPSTPVVGIQEGSSLLLKNEKLTLLGELKGALFLGFDKSSIQPGTDLSDLI